MAVKITMESAISKGLNFIQRELWPDGLVKSYGFDKGGKENEYDDLNNFVSGLTGLLLLDVSHPVSQKIQEAILQKLLDERINEKLAWQR